MIKSVYDRYEENLANIRRNADPENWDAMNEWDAYADAVEQQMGFDMEMDEVEKDVRRMIQDKSADSCMDILKAYDEAYVKGYRNGVENAISQECLQEEQLEAGDIFSILKDRLGLTEKPVYDPGENPYSASKAGKGKEKQDYE